jgi:AcrR family transcriptional regulator
MPRRSGKRYHHGDLRRALLDATLALAAERSPAGVSLRESARVAGVSQTAPYRHFPDKVTMLAVASEEGFQLLLRKIGELPPSGKPADGLVGWVGVYVQFAIEHPAHFRLMWGQGSPAKATTASLQDVARDTFQAFFRIVASLAAPWKLPQAALREVALELWSIAHGMATLALDGQTLFLSVARDRVHEVARRAAETYLKGLKARHAR